MVKWRIAAFYRCISIKSASSYAVINTGVPYRTNMYKDSVTGRGLIKQSSSDRRHRPKRQDNDCSDTKKFTLSAPPDGILVVSYIGYLNKQIPIKGKSILKIELEEDAEMLNEVVVVGYGAQKKVNLSGAVDQISMAQLEQRPIVDLAKGLQGMVPNLNIDFVSGEPGKAPNINIRGEASINGGSPLIY